MKLTKKILCANNICNSYLLAQKAGNKIFIDYVPADNGRLTSHYAYWKTQRLDFLRPENKSKEGSKHFTVTCRDEKEKVLKQAIAWIKQVYGIEITEKDPFGGWHPTFTMEKLSAIIGVVNDK